jgi:hypothetical protein
MGSPLIGANGFQRHVAGVGQLIRHSVHEDGANQAGDGGFIGEDADHLGSALDLAVEALQRVG